MAYIAGIPAADPPLFSQDASRRWQSAAKATAFMFKLLIYINSFVF